MRSLALSSFYFFILLNLISAIPLDVAKQEHVYGNLNWKNVFDELYHRLNVLTIPIQTDNIKRQTYQNFDGNVCVTKECIAQSHKLFQNMNFSVDP